MSLPDAWVERIFHKLSLVYGHQFISRWDGMPLDDVKADWGHELRGFAQNPGAITYGLEHLPASKPPTVLEFRALCNLGPATEASFPAIGYSGGGSPVVDPERVRREIAQLQEHWRSQPGRDPGSWAYDLAEKDRMYPKNVTPTVRRMCRESIAYQHKFWGKPSLEEYLAQGSVA